MIYLIRKQWNWKLWSRQKWMILLSRTLQNARILFFPALLLSRYFHLYRLVPCIAYPGKASSSLPICIPNPLPKWTPDTSPLSVLKILATTYGRLILLVSTILLSTQRDLVFCFSYLSEFGAVLYIQNEYLNAL